MTDARYRMERVYILSALLFVGLGLTLVLSRGVLAGDNPALGPIVPLMAVSVMLLAGTGALWVRAGLASASANVVPDSKLPGLPVPVSTVIPAMLAGGFVIFLQLFDSGAAQALIVVLAGASFAGFYWAQCHGAITTDRFFGLAQALLNVAVYLSAFLLFSVVYGLKLRSIVSATAVGFIALLLIYELLARDAAWHRTMGLPVEGRRGTVVLLSLACAVLLAELTWGLNYWAALTSLVGGSFLLVVFYVVAGLVTHYVDRTLTRRVIMEFGAVGVVGMVAVFVSAFTV